MGLDPNVTLRSLSLGSRDATTGWRAQSYAESTIKAVGTPRGARFSLQGVGVYATEDRMFTAAAPANVYDQILDGTKYYEIKTKQQFKILDSHLYYAYQCSELPLWQAPPASATWKTAPDDPRAKTKEYIDEKVRDAQITKNDGSTEASWACAFKPLPYTMELEFRGASNMNGLYMVGQPVTTSLLDQNLKPYGYKELVPVDIYTIDSTDCAGDPLAWRMEAEWRYVTETYVTGSQKNLETRRGEIINLGSLQLYHIPTDLSFVRDTS